MNYEYSDQVKLRLKKIEGQVRGVLRIMEEGKSCKDVVTQLSAVRNAADKAIAQLVAENLHQCIIDSERNGDSTEDIVKQAIDLLVKSR